MEILLYVVPAITVYWLVLCIASVALANNLLKGVHRREKQWKI